MIRAYERLDLTSRARALCDFVFRDGPALGLPDEMARTWGELLIKHWDGSLTVVEIYRRVQGLGGEVEEWPEVVGD